MRRHGVQVCAWTSTVETEGTKNGKWRWRHRYCQGKSAKLHWNFERLEFRATEEKYFRHFDLVRYKNLHSVICIVFTQKWMAKISFFGIRLLFNLFFVVFLFINFFLSLALLSHLIIYFYYLQCFILVVAVDFSIHPKIDAFLGSNVKQKIINVLFSLN